MFVFVFMYIFQTFKFVISFNFVLFFTEGVTSRMEVEWFWKEESTLVIMNTKETFTYTGIQIHVSVYVHLL